MPKKKAHGKKQKNITNGLAEPSSLVLNTEQEGRTKGQALFYRIYRKYIYIDYIGQLLFFYVIKNNYIKTYICESLSN